MQITINNDFNNGPRQFTQAEIASFLQDEQTAVNMLNATFTNNITLTFNVGFGSFEGQNLSTFPGVMTQDTSLGNINFAKADFLTYSQLRSELLQDGQPNFFTTTQSASRQQHQRHFEFLDQLQRCGGFRPACPE